jgi:negative regulator of sigma E activity
MRIFCLGLAFFCSSFALAQNASEPRAASQMPADVALLSRMLGASAQDVNATVVYATGTQLRTVRVTQQAGLSQAHAVDGARLAHSANRANAQMSAAVQQLLLASLQRSYQIQTLNQERVAERDTIQLLFTPRDGWRYRYVLWLDNASGVALKSELWHEQELLENMLVTQFEPGQRSVAAISSNDPPAVFRVLNAPDGFLRIRVRSRAAGGQQQIYSDGLSVISVYLNPVGSVQHGRVARGALSLLSRRIRTPTGEADVIALGDAPMPTIERFVSGVEVSR